MNNDGVWCSFFASSLKNERKLAVVGLTVGSNEEGQADVLLSFPGPLAPGLERFELPDQLPLFGVLSAAFTDIPLPSKTKSGDSRSTSNRQADNPAPLRENSADLVSVEASVSPPSGWPPPSDVDCVYRLLRIRHRKLSFVEKHWQHPSRFALIAFSYESPKLVHPGVQARPGTAGNPRYYSLSGPGMGGELTTLDHQALRSVEQPQFREGFQQNLGIELHPQATTLSMMRLTRACAAPIMQS